MTGLHRDRRGSILPMFAVTLTVFFMAASVAVDYARYVVTAEKLQTATDMAATAAASAGAKRYVRLLIDPGDYKDICCGPDDCHPCCKDCGDAFEVVGREDDLLDRNGYRRYCCSCGCGGMELLDRWVEYEHNGAEAITAAETFFDLNKPKEMDEGAGGESRIASISVRGNRGDPLYPSVIVRAEGRIKTLMMNFMDKLYPGTDLSSLGASRCSQGGSFYYDLNGKWHRAAREGCD
ncbi:MAG: hypothetical protein K6T66_14595 [Peptococcaceae bacterium]|nr:hypothetical protein [Peptococcaceae bacterium]